MALYGYLFVKNNQGICLYTQLYKGGKWILIERNSN